MTLGPVGIAAHQAEAEEDVKEELERHCNEWEFGNKDTYLRGSYACEHCSEENNEWTAEDEVYKVTKRIRMEMDPEEGENSTTGQRRQKVAKKTTEVPSRISPKGWLEGPLDMGSGQSR